MSLFLLVMSLLALFHLFYQSVIVKTNFELYENDLRLREHELDIYEIKKQRSINESEQVYFDDTREFLKDCKYVPNEYTILHLIIDSAKRDKLESDEIIKSQRLRRLASEELWEINIKTTRDIIKVMMFNGSFFLFLLSPLIMLVMLYGIVAGKKISIDQKIQRMSSRHC